MEDGGVSECAPYVCDQGSGKCLGKCTSASDCATTYVCDPMSQCVLPPAAASHSSGGCSLAAAPSLAGSEGAQVTLGVLTLLAAARRRRRA